MLLWMWVRRSLNQSRASKDKTVKPEQRKDQTAIVCEDIRGRSHAVSLNFLSYAVCLVQGVDAYIKHSQNANVSNKRMIMWAKSSAFTIPKTKNGQNLTPKPHQSTCGEHWTVPWPKHSEKAASYSALRFNSSTWYMQNFHLYRLRSQQNE